MITRLSIQWQAEHQAFCQRRLDDDDYVWADGSISTSRGGHRRSGGMRKDTFGVGRSVHAVVGRYPVRHGVRVSVRRIGTEHVVLADAAGVNGGPAVGTNPIVATDAVVPDDLLHREQLAAWVVR